ncbi:MAG: hypothetical protein MI919_34705 [Holophagales bacterium]|nr:hypothetical protein [Holophagales bacterium]
MNENSFPGLYFVKYDNPFAGHNICIDTEVTIEEVQPNTFSIASDSKNKLWAELTGTLQNGKIEGTIDSQKPFSIKLVSASPKTIECSYGMVFDQTGSWTADDEAGKGGT